MELRIDPELRSYLPIPDPIRVDELEQLILKNGCEQPIIVRNQTIVDGHHRYAICKKHGIPFETQELGEEYDTPEKIKIYMLERALFAETRVIDDVERRDMILRLHKLNVDSGMPALLSVDKIAERYGMSKRTAFRDLRAAKQLESIPQSVVDYMGGRDAFDKLSSASVDRFCELSELEQLDILERHGGDLDSVMQELRRRKDPPPKQPRAFVGEPDEKMVTPTKDDAERAEKRPAAKAIREALEHLAKANKALFGAKGAVKESQFRAWRQALVDLDQEWVQFIEDQMEREGVS